MERLVAPGAVSDDEERLLTSLRPRTLDEFIGQDLQRQRLSIALRAARERREPLEHLLLSGPPGLGKTTLAHIVAHEMGGSLVTTSGPALDKTLDLMGMLTGLEEGDVFFIDEIHRMPRIIEEYLYPAMEDFKVDFVLDKGPFAKAIQIPLKRFTLVGATTRVGLLSAPLRDRFGLTFALDFYAVADLTLIVDRSAGLLDVRLGDDAAEEIARRSRGTPRIANRLLRRVGCPQSQVTDRLSRCPPTGGRALDEPLVQQERLDHVFERVLFLLHRRCEGGDASRPAFVLDDERGQVAPIQVVETELIDPLQLQ